MKGPTLVAVRDAVLSLHRALLETERLAWERMNGRTVGNVELLIWRSRIRGSPGFDR